MSGGVGTILLAPEAETHIENLQVFPLIEIGSPKWTQQHEYIEKLNMQACLTATANEDEYIKEFLISYEKIPILIQELITIEVWKNKVFPEFLDHDLELKVSFPLYMVLYHEATVANLLETVLYHSSACESAEECIIDLLDYCYRKIISLISKSEAGEISDQLEQELESLQLSKDSSCLDELERQDEKLSFDICIKAVSILRYLTDHIKFLPLSVVQRILNTHDIPLLLVKLIECPPWTKRNGNKLKKYVDNKWQEIPYEDQFQLTKIEGQVWIALFHLLMEEECQNKYEFDDYRKNVLLRLRSHLNEVLLDQMPVLGEMQRYLEQLSIMQPPSSRRSLILEQVPEIQDKILKIYDGKWTKIAKKQHKAFFNNTDANIQAQAQRLSEMYDFDMLEALISDPPKCAVCGEPATKRCSRCQNEWYCRRECQVSHWKKHKPACDLLMDVSTDLKDQAQKNTADNGSEIVK